MEKNADIEQRAERLAAQMDTTTGPFAGVAPEFDAAYRDLLAAVARTGERYAFDRDGRPAAIAAVREALPVMERDLFDAIVDDHACEVAAIEEALYRLALAYGRRGRGPA